MHIFISFIKYIYKYYFMLLDAIINIIIFLILCSDCLLKLYRHTTEFYIFTFILHPY